MLLQSLYIPLSINEAFTDVGTNTPSQPLAVEVSANNNQNGPFPPLARKRTFTFCISPSQISSGPREVHSVSR